MQLCKANTYKSLVFFLLNKVVWMMAYLTLLLITTIFTVASGATPLLYCSDVQSPASGNHNTDLSQVTTLQYCIIDNCTIMRIDNGQQLDIVYTTESLLIVTPIDDHTSMVIAKIDNEMPCLKFYNTIDDTQGNPLVGITIISLLIMMASGYVVIVHLLFKQLRSLFRKLLIFYNLCVMSTMGGVIVTYLMHYQITVNSQTICHTVLIVFMMIYTSTELYATNILTHLAYIMYRCYNLKPEMSDKRSKFLFRCYNAYAFITLVLFFFIAIAYDWRTGNGRYTILPNGHCNSISQYSYTTLFLNDIFISINKFIQIAMFLAYVVYFYKLKVNIGNPIQYNRELFRIAIAMGATIGVSYFIWVLLAFDPNPQHADIIGISGGVLLLIQQGVIMASFMCTKKMSDLCKAYFSSEEI